MIRAAWRRRLAGEWTVALLLTLLPLLLLGYLWGSREAWLPALELPLFVAGLCAPFATLPLFRRYKQALISTQRALDSEAEGDAWQALGRTRRPGLLAAALPAWGAALALPTGLNGVALTLLTLTSLVLLWLYKIPRQLG